MYKNFSHIKNVSENGENATMLLNKRIGNAYNDDGTLAEAGIQGDQFANEMLYLKGCMKVKNIDVEINSIGGDVMHGYDIVNAIIKHDANTIVTGMCASMAVSCMIAGNKRSIVDFGSIMTHAVSGGEDADNKVLGIFQDSLKTMYLGRTKMNADTADTMFKGENWFSNSKKADYSLQDAIDMGFVDSIINTGKKIKEVTNAKKELSSLAHIYNTLNITKTENMIELKKVLNLKNDLSDEKAESIAIETINTLKVENATQKTNLEASVAKVTELQKKIDEIENAAKVEKTRVATEMVENAIAKGLIKLEKGKEAENKAGLIELAETNLSAFNTLVGASNPGKAAVIFNHAATAQNADDRSNWTAYDWAKKDSKGLKAALAANPDFYNTLKKA